MTLDTKSTAIGTINTVIYQAPAGSEALVPFLLINNTANTQDTVTISLFDYNQNQTNILGEIKVSRYAPVQPFTKPLLVCPGDQIIMSSLGGTCRAVYGADVAIVLANGGLNPRGVWTTGAQYTAASHDMVSYNGSSYICNTDHQAGASFDATKWVVLASVGAGANSRRYALGGCAGDNVTYGYDGSGRISTIADTVDGQARSTTYTYDGAGRVSQVVRTWQGVTHTDLFAYDATTGNLTGTSTTEA